MPRRLKGSMSLLNNEEMEKRNSSFEMLRIICMLMIIGGHVIMKHHTEFDLHSTDYSISLFFRGAFAVAVNAFVLISGYFGIKFKWQRLIRLDIQTLFYSIALLIVSVSLGWHAINPQKDFLLLFPVLSKQYWFITCYVILYIISPLLNRWGASLNKKEYRSLLIVGCTIIYVWPTLSYLVNAPQFIGDAGYGIINFMYLYMLGYYLRCHYDDIYSVRYYWGGYFAMVTLLFIAQYGLSYILGFEFTSWISYNSLFVFGGAIFIFLSFKNLTFQSSFVNNLARPCLAVYLIHLHPCVWSAFCESINLNTFHGILYFALIFAIPVVVYLVCILVESCRLKLFCRLEEKVAVNVVNYFSYSKYE